MKNIKNPLLIMLAKDKHTISYRPEFKAITGSVTSAILLQQIYYWWSTNNFKPFYKFKTRCDHKLYKSGDSWTEELGFSGNEFDTALEKISTKVKKHGERPENALVWHWIDNDRRTYYDINPEYFSEIVSRLYSGELESIGKTDFTRGEDGRFASVTPESGFTVVNPENGVTKNGDADLRNTGKPIYLQYSTDTTTDTTTKPTQPNGSDFLDESEIEDLENQIAAKKSAAPPPPRPAAPPPKKKKPAPETKWNGSFSTAVKIFDEQHRIWAKVKKGIDGASFAWNGKEIGQLSNLLTALKEQSGKTGHVYGTDKEFVEQVLTPFLNAAGQLEKYYMNEFTPTRFYSNFNTVLTDIKSFIANGKSNPTHKTGRNGHSFDPARTAYMESLLDR